jgi:hypothetical protein
MPSSPGDREFPYRVRWRTILLSGGFFGLCAVVLAHRADTNDRGLIINGIIELEPDSATTFYWVLTLLAAGFVVAAGFMAVHRLTVTQRLVLGADAMTVPASRWSSETRSIAYRDIRQMTLERMSGQTYMTIRHTGGKFVLVASMLPSNEAFADIRGILEEKAGGDER